MLILADLDVRVCIVCKNHW